MKKILLLLLCFPLLVFSQEEKRLALVIGNANYDKGELKNPVNDALLVTETLKKLKFDVILDTNITNRGNFIRKIREFGTKRPNYDVAFVYYAGHGIQVGSENYLLPTKEVFKSENDVIDFGVSVQNIMRYLTGMTNQVNILILDACRDNPFEANWHATRSLKGKGLAKIPPPTGSLIAFSTDAGNTAADGDGKNSIYCESLCKNMMLENTSLDQLFRNVRSDVLKLTTGQQRPVEASQLTGSTYYLIPPSNEMLFKKVDEYLIKDIRDSAMIILNSIISFFPNESLAFAKRGHINLMNSNDQDAYNDYTEALRLNPDLREAMIFTINTNDDNEYNLGITQLLSYDQSIDLYDHLLSLDPNDHNARLAKVREKSLSGDSLLALESFKDLNYLDSLLIKCGYVDPLDKLYQIPEQEYDIKEIKQLVYNNFAYAYRAIGDHDAVILYMKKSLNANRIDRFGNAWAYYTIGEAYEEKNNLKEAEYYYTKAINTDALSYFIRSRATMYKKQEKYDLAIIDYKNSLMKAMNKAQVFEIGASSFHLSRLYIKLKKNFKAFRILNEGILYLSTYVETDSYGLFMSKDLLALRSDLYRSVDEVELMCLDLKQYVIYSEMYDWSSQSIYAEEIIGNLDNVKNLIKTHCK